MIRVLLVGSHPMARAGLARILQREPEFNLLAQASTSEEAARLVERSRAEVLVLDLDRALESIEACAHLLEQKPEIAVILLTDSPDQRTMISAFNVGARGLLRRESDEGLLRQAVRAVANGGTFVDPALASGLVTLATKGIEPKGPYGLSRQQMRVLSFLPRGLSNREIGEELGLSDQTVKSHVRGVLRKLRVTDRAQAAAVAVREGFA